jgi:cytochrome c553
MDIKRISMRTAYFIIAAIILAAASLPDRNPAFAAGSMAACNPRMFPCLMQPEELFGWLKAGNYLNWYHDGEIHQSAGPHNMVRTFYNQILEDSMKAGNKTHPMGAMAVKELYQGDKLIGWSSIAKIKDTGDQPSQWYFYQTQDITDPTKYDTAEPGAAACTVCHVNGEDMILSGFPLKSPVERVDSAPAKSDPLPTTTPPAASDPPAKNGGPKAPPPMSIVPTDTGKLFAWLQADSYKDWQSNTEIHQSAGPHGMVKVFYSPGLYNSMKAGNTVHPLGSSAVKELYDANDALIGWLVLNRTKNTKTERDNWFFYWVTSTTDGSQPKVADWGVTTCADCHQKGTGMIMSGYPLP